MKKFKKSLNYILIAVLLMSCLSQLSACSADDEETKTTNTTIRAVSPPVNDSADDSSEDAQEGEEAQEGDALEMGDEEAKEAAPEENIEDEEAGISLTLGEEGMRIGALKGPTALGLVNLMQENRDKEYSYEFRIESAPDAIVPLIVKGEVDIACIPSNLAAVLYQKTSKDIQVFGINTMSNLYIAEKGQSINSVEDLAGKKIISAGKGATPELALNFILDAAGISDSCEVEYKEDHAAVVAAAAAGEADVIVLPQPFLASATAKVPELRKAIDMGQAFTEATAESESGEAEIIMGVFVARKEFIENQSDKLHNFMSRAGMSIMKAQEDAAATAELAVNLGIFPDVNVLNAALPECGIDYYDGENMASKLQGYYQKLYEFNPKTVGGELPDDDFYYIPQISE